MLDVFSFQCESQSEVNQWKDMFEESIAEGLADDTVSDIMINIIMGPFRKHDWRGETLS